MLNARRGETLMGIFKLLDDQVNSTCSSSVDSSCCSSFWLNRSSFYHIEASLDLGSAAESNNDSFSKKQEDSSLKIDIPSCVHFMIDLYTQWLQNPVSFILPSIFFTYSRRIIYYSGMILIC